MKLVDTRGLSFSSIMSEDYYYVDKSLLIKDILDSNPHGVYLFTRPRRFGKTTNLSMLDAFFNIEYKGNNWFDGLAISDYPEYERYKNAFPVIKLNLKDTKCSDVDYFLDRLKSAISVAYLDHMYLMKSDVLSEREKSNYEEIRFKNIKNSFIPDCIPELCRLLNAYYGVKPIVLIDEYDRAVSDSFGEESHRKIMDYLGSFLSPILKNNDNVQMAYVTGVMQIAKESIFSGLNNLSVNNVFSIGSDERFGFTEAEIKDLFAYYGHPEKFAEAKEWYDGYRFGNAEVYNPFSIMNYVSNHFIPKQYWVNSGSDVPITWLLERTNTNNFSKIFSLIDGKSANVRLEEALTYAKLGSTDVALYSLMVMSGYLKAVPNDNETYSVSIPNKEVMKIVDKMALDLCPVDYDAFGTFNRAVLEGDAETMTRELGKILSVGSYYNLTTELHYEAVLMTILYEMIPSYEVRTETEYGNGRVDIVLIPKKEGTVPIIIELKKADTEENLEVCAENAVKQIHDRKYYANMHGKVILIGLAFWGKIPKSVVETIGC